MLMLLHLTKLLQVGDDALIFNVEPGSKDDIATDAIAPEVSTISVTATEGAVVIKVLLARLLLSATFLVRQLLTL